MIDGYASVSLRCREPARQTARRGGAGVCSQKRLTEMMSREVGVAEANVALEPFEMLPQDQDFLMTPEAAANSERRRAFLCYTCEKS